MAKTSAERQAEYRARRQFAGDAGNGERRLSTWINTGSMLALGRLATRYGVTKREVIERLLRDEDEKVQVALRNDDSAWQAYIEQTTVTR